MTTSSKILTVTYGTFSCTLEGFDDPFTTLQMVAEYFRRLAAEDRFFGSTPQTPDAETLKRIAEENTSKAIDAELADDGIILRQSEQAPEQTPEPLSEPSDEASDAPLVFDSIRNDDTESATESATAPAADAAPTEETPEPAPPLTFFRSRRGEQDEAATGQEPAPVKDADANAIETAIAAAGVAASATALRQSEENQDLTEGKAASQKSVEETLAAIRHNVEQAESSIDAELADEEGDEEGAPVATEPAEETLDPLILGADTAIPQDPAEEETAPHVAERQEADTAPTEAEIEDETAEEEFDTRHSSLTPEQEAELAADLEAAMQSDEEAPEGDDITALDEAESDGAQEQDPQEDGAEQEALAELEIEPESEPETETEIETGPSRADLLLASGDAAEEDGALDRLLQATQSKMNKPEQLRRMNALDQLKAAVAATEADRKIRRKSVAETHNEAEEGDAADLAAYRDDLRRAQDSARLEGLKTAASSAPAARPAAAPIQQSPLILVSEQRIDEAPAEITPAAPEPQREVAEINGNLALKPDFEPEAQIHEEDGEIQGIPADAFSDATSFSDFAERIGAFELTDLLEASAAYTSIIEERPRFSRAQVMSKLAKLNIGDAYTKEAGLRSFGKLLREGKILRVQDGQFAISKASRFSVAQRYND